MRSKNGRPSSGRRDEVQPLQLEEGAGARRAEHRLAQVAGLGPEELVRVVVEDPVASARHARHSGDVGALVAPFAVLVEHAHARLIEHRSVYDQRVSHQILDFDLIHQARDHRV